MTNRLVSKLALIFIVLSTIACGCDPIISTGAMRSFSVGFDIPPQERLIVDLKPECPTALTLTSNTGSHVQADITHNQFNSSDPKVKYDNRTLTISQEILCSGMPDYQEDNPPRNEWHITWGDNFPVNLNIDFQHAQKQSLILSDLNIRKADIVSDGPLEINLIGDWNKSLDLNLVSTAHHLSDDGIKILLPDQVGVKIEVEGDTVYHSPELSWMGDYLTNDQYGQTDTEILIHVESKKASISLEVVP